MPHSPSLPCDPRPDSTLTLLREGYEFIGHRARDLGSRAFETRLLLERMVCVTGAEAARMFYDDSRVQRRTAAPEFLTHGLFGVGGVQGLDGEEHRHRKAMLMSLMSDEEVARLAALSAGQWEAYAERWARRPRVVLLDEVSELLCRAVCEWSGVPLEESEVARRTAQLTQMVEGTGKVSLEHLRARCDHQRAKRWAQDVVQRVRRQERPPTGRTDALRTIAWHRDPRGDLLDEPTAAVEVLNILRPTVAVARWVVFLAVALHTHSGARERLTSGEWEPEWFIEEVRRFYPFFPAIVGRTSRAFEWNGLRFPSGRRVLLDVYGTNRDGTRWEAPGAFRPERFRDREVGRFEFIPQGGGDYYEGHRCAGEWIALALMRAALDFLVHRLEYDVPPQDLRISLARMPAQPESGFVIVNVRGRARGEVAR